MEHPLPFPDPLAPGSLPSALAPMQDVTDLAFMRLLAKYGLPDTFVTEYFRVHGHSTPEAHILRSITRHETGRPVFAQMIGEDLLHLRRTALILQDYPVAGIDLNMGCPAPKVYRKNVGGGLLRDPDKIDQILGTLRDCCPGRFTVKMRIGFEDKRNFDKVLSLLDKHSVDALSLHGRTVKQMYRGTVDYPAIKKAAAQLRCPVFANGNITSAEKAVSVRKITGCYGVMVGRSAIRNPWIFRQIRERSTGQTVYTPRMGDVRAYVSDLWEMTTHSDSQEIHRLNRMKKFLNFIGQGVDAEGRFLHEMRRTRTATDFFSVCDRHMIENGKADALFVTEPYTGVIARPNHED